MARHSDDQGISSNLNTVHVVGGIRIELRPMSDRVTRSDNKFIQRVKDGATQDPSDSVTF